MTDIVSPIENMIEYKKVLSDNADVVALPGVSHYPFEIERKTVMK